MEFENREFLAVVEHCHWSAVRPIRYRLPRPAGRINTEAVSKICGGDAPLPYSATDTYSERTFRTRQQLHQLLLVSLLRANHIEGERMAPALQQPLGDAQSGASGAAESNGHHSRKEFTILVTGFGPFQDKFPVNPSFEITQRLPECLPATSQKHPAIRIIPYPNAIRVAFETVRQLVPLLHNDYAGRIDAVLHIGMASGRKHYCLERYAHRDGYVKNRDLDGKMPSADEGRTIFGDCPPKMTTSLDYDDILLKWQSNVLGIPEGTPGCDAEVKESHDAGHYLCDYIYFNSLAHTGRCSGKMQGGDITARPVLFLHVPAESNGDMLERGTTITTELIRAIADSFATGKTD